MQGLKCFMAWVRDFIVPCESLFRACRVVWLTGINKTAFCTALFAKKSFDIVAATRPAPLSTVRVCVCECVCVCVCARGVCVCVCVYVSIPAHRP